MARILKKLIIVDEIRNFHGSAEARENQFSFRASVAIPAISPGGSARFFPWFFRQIIFGLNRHIRGRGLSAGFFIAPAFPVYINKAAEEQQSQQKDYNLIEGHKDLL
jgi:hypothetical protein